MTISVTHSTVVVVPDDGTSPVGTDEWNAGHTLSMATGKILGRATAGTGAVEEIATTGTGSVVLATAPTIAGIVTLSDTTASLNPTTGALTVAGGVGVGGDFSVQGGLNVVLPSFYYSNVHLKQTVATGAGFWLDSLITGQDRMFCGSDTSAADKFRIYSILAGDNVVAYQANAIIDSGLLAVKGGLTLSATTASTNTTTGALTVAGGAGIALDLFVGGGVSTGTVAVASLPAAASGNKGMRMMVSNATATTFWSIVAGGGANIVPVTSDGTNWRIG